MHTDGYDDKLHVYNQDKNERVWPENNGFESVENRTEIDKN